MDPEKKTEEAIRKRAYELWELQGRQGDPLEHWFQAKWEFESIGEKGQAAIPAAGQDQSNPTSSDLWRRS